jgi:hypothetical protein
MGERSGKEIRGASNVMGAQRSDRDADKKRALLRSWWTNLLPDYSFHLFDAHAPLDPKTAMARLTGLPAVPSIYVLLADIDGEVTPVYVGKADDPSVRWRQHLDGWENGAGCYVRWRQALLDAGGRVRYRLTLLVVPAGDIVSPPLPGFPTTVGSVEGAVQSFKASPVFLRADA